MHLLDFLPGIASRLGRAARLGLVAICVAWAPERAQATEPVLPPGQTEEPNDTQAQAFGPLRNLQFYLETVAADDPVNVHWFVPKHSGHVTVLATNYAGVDNNCAAIDITLATPDGKPMTNGALTSNGQEESLSFEAVADQRIVLSVGLHDPSCANVPAKPTGYRIRIDIAGAPDESASALCAAATKQLPAHRTRLRRYQRDLERAHSSRAKRRQRVKIAHEKSRVAAAQIERRSSCQPLPTAL